MKSPKIIAEIGCNHKGDMAIAKEMIMTAATYCKVDVVKFQKRCNKELLTPEEYNAPHPHPENSSSSWSLILTSTANCKNGATSSVWNIPLPCGTSLPPRKSVPCIPI